MRLLLRLRYWIASPVDWADSLKKPYGDSLKDPVKMGSKMRQGFWRENLMRQAAEHAS